MAESVICSVSCRSCGTREYFLHVPSSSSLCGQCGQSAPLLQIFRSRLTNSQSEGPCFVLASFRGSMLSYRPSAPLHIGLSDGLGKTYAFERCGVHIDTNWPSVLTWTLPSATDHPKWPDLLAKHARKWRHRRYNARSCNCFDFVVAFLRRLGIETTKSRLSREYLCPLLAGFEAVQIYGPRIPSNPGASLVVFPPRIRQLICGCSLCNPLSSTVRVELCVADTVCDHCRRPRLASLGCRPCRGLYCPSCFEMHVFASEEAQCL